MPVGPATIVNPGGAFGYSIAQDPGSQLTVVYDPSVLAGVELGRASTATTYTPTTGLTAYPGLSVPVTIPPGVNIFVEAELPGFLQGAAATTIALEILRDNVQIAASNQGIPANQLGVVRCSLSETPPSGNHIYSVSIQLGGASAGAVSEGGPSVFGLYAMSPYLRVVVC